MFDLNADGLLRLVIGNAYPFEVWHILTLLGFVLISVVAGYLLGSINSAILLSKLIYRDDIRNHGSKNAGMTNMLRTYGKGAAGLTLLVDLLKTAVAILIGGILGGFGYASGISTGFSSLGIPLPYIAGFAAVVGHILPIYYGFKGGKGVLCTATMALILTPVDFLILLLVFILIVATTKFVSLGSVVVAALYPVVVHAHMELISTEEGGINLLVAIITIALAIIIVYCHRENLRRISRGEERKLSFKKKDKNNGDEG